MSAPLLPSLIEESRIIAILRGLDTARAVDVTTALAEAGIAVVEITMDSPRAEETVAALAGSDLTVGAGTVTSLKDARLAVEAGAEFLVAPYTDVELVSTMRMRGIPMVPGVMTPTEAVEAVNAGASAVKLFPASAVGSSLVGALSGPLPDIQVIPTGGITSSNAREFLDAGALAVGIGGWLTGSGDLNVVASRASEVIAACAEDASI